MVTSRLAFIHSTLRKSCEQMQAKGHEDRAPFTNINTATSTHMRAAGHHHCTTPASSLNIHIWATLHCLKIQTYEKN